MMLSIMVVGAGAAFADQSDIDTKHTEAVDMCNALNIITGFENGKFMPKDNVTREQMAKMICVLDNGGKEPQLATGNTFSDVAADRWSNKYIEACASRGVVVGVGGGKFAPAGKVTATQAAKMLLVELGYDDGIQKYSGSDWATKVNVDATKKGYYKDLEDIDVNVPLTREHAAQMIWNALQANVVDYTYTLVTNPDGSITSKVTEGEKKGENNEPISLLAEKYKGEVDEGILMGFDYDSNKKTWTYTVDGDTYIPDVKSSQDFTALLGQKVKVSYDNSGTSAVKDAYGIFTTDSEIVLEGRFGDLPKMTNRAETSFKMDGTTYKLDKAIGVLPVYQFYKDFEEDYQGGNLYAIAGGDTITYDAQKFIAVDQDGNGKIDFFMVTPFSIAKVTYANNDKFRITPKYGDYAAGTEITKEDVEVYDGIAKDDYVAIVADKNTANDTTVFTKVDLMSGKVTSKDAPDLTVDGTVYTQDASFTKEIKAGATLTDAVVYNDYIFDADTSANFDISDYVVIIDGNNSGYNATVKLLFSDGTKKVVDLADATATIGGVAPFSDSTFNSNLKGVLCTYDTNKDGEYTLTKATTKDTGFDYADGSREKGYFASASTGYVPDGDGSVSVDRTSKNSAKVGYIDSKYKVADDAVIFIEYNTTTASPSYKVITGANLKSMSTTAQALSGYYVLATDNSTSGVGEVNMAYVTTNQTSVKTNDSQYAYVLKVVDYENADKEQVKLVTLMTKDGVQEPIETVKDIAGYKNMLVKGNAIEYTLDTDGKLDEIVNYANAMAPITAITDDTLWINEVGHELDDDVIVLVVDASETEAVNVGSVSDLSVADKPDTYLPNAYVIYSEYDASPYAGKTGSDIMLVVYDIDNGVTSSTATVEPLTLTGPESVTRQNTNRVYRAVLDPAENILPGQSVTATISMTGSFSSNSTTVDTVTLKLNGKAVGDPVTFSRTSTSAKTVTFTANESGTLTLDVTQPET